MRRTTESRSIFRAVADERASESYSQAVLRPDDPAVAVMADFDLNYPHTIDVSRSVDEAFDCLCRLGEHSLLVMRPDTADGEPEVAGVITLFDIYRAHRMRRATTSSAKIHELCIEKVMKRASDLALLSLETLRSLTVREVFDMFQGTSHTLLLVIDKVDRHGHAVAKGAISRGVLAKRLRGSSRPA